MPDNSYQMSSLDRSIIDVLKKDGRLTNPKIAETLGVSAVDVGAHIRRMEDAKAMKIVAVVDFAALGYNYLFPVGIDVRGRVARDVASDIAAFKEVLVVQLVMGKNDIEVLIALSDMSDLSDFLMTKLLKVRGVRDVEAALAVDIHKYEFEVAPV